MPGDVSRRQALALLGGSIVGAVAWVATRDEPSLAGAPCATTTLPPTTTTLPPTTTTTLAGLPRWSTLGLAGHVVLPGDVLLDTNPTVDSLRIPAGTRLVFDPAVSHTLTSRGNITVEGVLETRPASPAVVHDISFVGINEAGFVGGGMDPIASDVGLWVMGAGIWNAAGIPKNAWARLTQGATAGLRTLSLDAVPAGWQPGDRLVVAPTEPPTTASYAGPNFANRYSDTTIQSVNGNTVTLTAPLTNNHPLVLAGLGAEVLNLSRNVKLHGEPGKRTHVFVRSVKQNVSNVELFNVGPRKGQAGVLGRYGLHVHMCGDTSRGSVYDGVVVHDGGGHAFVPHSSHGVSFLNCISHSTFEDAYWWDAQVDTRTPGPPTHDVVYDRCVASFVRWYDGTNAPVHLRLCGFNLGRGDRDTIRNSVAVGVEGGYGGHIQRSGFLWDEAAFIVSTWKFEDCVAHNNGNNGIFVWQNTDAAHIITRFVGYHNGRSGIKHGAYANRYRYEDSILYANLYSAIEVHATSEIRPMVFSNVVCDGNGLPEYLVVGLDHLTIPREVPTRFERCTFRRARKAAFGFVTPKSGNPDLVDVIDSTFDGNQLWLGDTIDSRTLIRFIDGSTVVNARRKDQPGTFKPEWNARVS